MEPLNCCSRPDLHWRQSKVGERHADMLVCLSCGHIHEMQSQFVPLWFPSRSRCINCGGSLLAPGALDVGPCSRCGLTDQGALDLHTRLLNGVLPGASFHEAASIMVDHERHVLALKLATAHLRLQPHDPEARAIRLQTLDSMGYKQHAVDEAWDWATSRNALGDAPEPPGFVWSILADLEASRGNLEGAMRALQRGILAVPDDAGMVADYAELLYEADQRQTALDAAGSALRFPETRERSLTVIRGLARRFYAEGAIQEAFDATLFAGEDLERDADLCWLRAQIAATRQDRDDAVAWLNRVIAHEPSHEGARAALDRIRPSRGKRGWFRW